MELIYIATFVVAFLSSILSGIAGTGGGFIMAPYWLIAGLNPAQAATTGSFMALGMGGSSLAAFKGSGHLPRNKKLLAALVAITLATSAIGPFFLQYISVDIFKPIIAIMTLLSIPMLFISRKNISVSKKNKIVGVALLILLLIANGFITSSAFSIFIVLVLSQTFQFTAMQSTALRRLIGLAQAAVIFGILVTLGNFVWTHALIGIIGASLGSYIGTKLAIKKGEQFAKYALAAGGAISAFALLV